jgi:Arc/MetJ-type ribon-helix-helix transcriptional regulator
MKIKTSASIDEELLKWLDGEIEKMRFASRSHGINYALQKLKESEEG